MTKNAKLREQLLAENTLEFWHFMIGKLYGSKSRALEYLDALIDKHGKHKQVESGFGEFMGALNEIHRGVIGAKNTTQK